MHKLLVAIAAGMLLLASAVSASALSGAKAQTAPGGPGPSCTQTQTTSGPEQEKEQPESKTQDVESQQGTQEGQSGDAKGENHDTGPAASSNEVNDGEKEVKDDGTAAGDQPQQNAGPASTKPRDSNLQEDNRCGDASAGQAHGQALKTGHGSTSSGAADSNRNDD
jgi:hypothetical protein